VSVIHWLAPGASDSAQYQNSSETGSVEAGVGAAALGAAALGAAALGAAAVAAAGVAAAVGAVVGVEPPQATTMSDETTARPPSRARDLYISFPPPVFTLRGVAIFVV